MKKMVLLLAVGFMATTGFSQNKKSQEILKSIEGQWKLDEKEQLTYQQIIEIPGTSDSLLFERTKNFLKTNHKPNSLKEIYPEVYTLTIQDTLKNLIKSITPKVSANYIFKIDCKDSKARLTLSVLSLNIDYSTYDKNTYAINRIYPINQGSLIKNDHVEWFNATHNAALKKMEDVATYLKGPKTDGDNW